MGLAAVAAHKLGGIVSGGRDLQDFHLIGQRWVGRPSATAQVRDELRVLP
jgi:hypothetical protein